MPKLFIIEGVDSTGKSTLARSLAIASGAVYLHASGHKSLHGIPMMAHHVNLVENARANLHHGLNVVMDRLWASEVVYSRILRPGMETKYNARLIIDMLHELQKKFAADIKYVYCHSHNGWERYQETHATPVEGHARYTSAQYYALRAEYRVIFDTFPHREYQIEEQGYDMQDFIDKLLV